MKFDVYHEARQTSQLFSPDRFRCSWYRGAAHQWVTQCILLKAKWAVSFCWLPPVLTFNCDGDLKKAFNECLGVSYINLMLEPVALLGVLSIVSLIRGSIIPSLHHDTAASKLLVYIYAVPD